MNEIFSKRLRGLRAASKLTQDEAANNIGIGKVTLARYELGGQSPTAENLEKIADYFCVPTDYLLGRIDTPYHVTSTTSAVTGDPAPLVSMRFSIRWPFVIIDGPYHR